MLHELRIETSRPGRLPALAMAFAATGRRAAGGASGTLRGAWTSEAGELNKLYTLWEHADERACAEAVAQRETDDAWRRYVDAIAADVVQVETIRLAPMRDVTVPPPDRTLVDFRMYTLAPFRADDYVRNLLGILPVRQKFSDNFCIWKQHTGTLHRVMHMWPYRSYEHRAEVRAGMAGDPDWNRFLDVVYPLMVTQQSSLLRVLHLEDRH